MIPYTSDVFAPMGAFLFFGAPEFYEEYVTPLVSHFRRDEIKQVGRFPVFLGAPANPARAGV